MRAAVLCLLLAGCAGSPPVLPTIPAAPTQQVVVRTVCLPLKTYSAGQEADLGAAVAALPSDSPIIPAMADYGAMRAADRAACVGP